MTEQELRVLVREAITRHVSGTAAPQHRSDVTPSHGHPVPPIALHASHGVFMVPDGSESGGPCIIEPTVMCTHCGYCKSYGH
jgi:hypothetical protein